MVVIILWIFLSVLLIAFFPVEWGRALVYMLAEGFGHDAVRVDQTVDLDPIIKQFPYVLSLGLLVVSVIVVNYRYVCAGTRKFGRDARAAWNFVLRSGREHFSNNRAVMIGLGVVTLIARVLAQAPARRGAAARGRAAGAWARRRQGGLAQRRVALHAAVRRLRRAGRLPRLHRQGPLQHVARVRLARDRRLLARGAQVRGELADGAAIQAAARGGHTARRPRGHAC